MSNSLDGLSSLELKVQRLKKRHALDISKSYKHNIEAFALDKFDVILWDSEIADSQLKIANEVMYSYLKQEERQLVSLGELELDKCIYYKDGEVIKTIIDIQSGHGTGKSYLSAIVALWVYTVFDDSVVYTFSPNKNQAVAILWRDIRTLHTKGGLKGKALELTVKSGDASNFIVGRVAPTNKKQDTTSVHGLHANVFCSVVDEAQHYGVGLYDGLDSIMSGGIAVMLLSSNPKSSTAPARRYRVHDYCANFTLNALYHPNVYFGANIVNGGVLRDYVVKLLQGCEPTDTHQAELNTFTIHWADNPEQIYIPSSQFSWRVLGVPSTANTGNVFFSSAMIDDAIELPLALDDNHNVARIGIDVARYGSDDGTIFWRGRGQVQLFTTISKQSGNAYVRQIGRLLNQLLNDGYTDVQVRIDSTGGYGSTIEDTLDKNSRWTKQFSYFEIVPVNFRTNASDVLSYSDIVTEMYAETSNQLKKGLRYRGFVPETLVTELVNRTFEYVPITATAIKRLKHPNPQSLYRQEVKRISKKRIFKNEFGYSPDYADGLVLTCSPDWVFLGHTTTKRTHSPVRKLQRAIQRRRKLIVH